MVTFVVVSNCYPAMADAQCSSPIALSRFESAPAANGDAPCSNGISRYRYYNIVTAMSNIAPAHLFVYVVGRGSRMSVPG
jgi:hypothetical protein